MLVRHDPSSASLIASLCAESFFADIASSLCFGNVHCACELTDTAMGWRPIARRDEFAND